MICAFCKEDKPANQFGRKAPHPRYGLWCKQCECNRASVRKHGITIPQKSEIAEHQGGCAICGHEEPGSKGWVVDHDHECCPDEKSCPACRRGVLCGWCNKMLAYAFDRPQILRAAIAYLERHAEQTCAWHMPLACAPRICGNADSASSTDVTDGTYGEPSDYLAENVALGNARRGVARFRRLRVGNLWPACAARGLETRAHA